MLLQAAECSHRAGGRRIWLAAAVYDLKGADSLDLAADGLRLLGEKVHIIYIFKDVCCE